MFWLCSDGLFSLLDVLVFGLLSSNLALVNNFFRLEGWRLLLMSLILFVLYHSWACIQ